jgi:acyl-CoA thioester hydrolase
MTETRIRIRWADLDPLGHVNQSVYVTYAEEAIDAWFRERVPGFEDYAAVRLELDYRSELRLQDREVLGAVELVRLGTSSITLRCVLSAPDGCVAAQITSTVVAFDRAARRSRPLTDDERAALGR